MSNLTTITQNVLRDLHLDTTSSGTQATNDVKRAIIDSMVFLETEAPWFNRFENFILLQQDVYEYPLPVDYRSIEGYIFYIPDVSEMTIKWPIKTVPLDLIRERLSTGLEWESTIDQGSPRMAAVDSKSMRLLVAPVPDTTTSGLIFDISKSGNIPIYEYTGSAWAFYYPETTVALDAAFTNFWIKEAYHVIYNKACEALLNGVYGGTNAALSKSREYNRKALLELNKLRAKQTKFSSINTIQKHI